MAKETIIEVVEIDLDIDVEKEIRQAASSISEASKQKADEIVAEKVEEKAKKDAIKKEKEQKQNQWNDKLDACHARLIHQMNEKDPLVSAEELMLIAETDDLTGLMLRIRNYMKRIESAYKLEKRKRQKKTHYMLSSG
jgi:hypothetical protein